MEITREMYVPGSEGEQGRTIYITAKEGISEQVLESFLKEFRADPLTLLDMNIGQERPEKSGYNEKWYELFRKSDHTFYLRLSH